MIKILPAIDLIDGRCVRLTQGEYSLKKIYDGSPVDMAKSLADCGVERIHIVDLDGAKLSAPRNLAVLEKIAYAVGCQIEWGGGIADSTSLESVFSAGATHAIIGSVAALKPELFMEWIGRHGDKMILGADVKDRMIAVKGWQESAGLRIDEFIPRFRESGLAEVICTDIGRDGMLEGPSTELYTELQSLFPDLSFTVSGGISSMADIGALDRLSFKKVIVGKAIYEGRITLKDIESWSQNA